jgi:hypothetical protein
MKSKSLVTVILLLGSGTVLADQQIASVQVRPVARYALEISCSNPSTPSVTEVENLLQINDRSQTHGLSNKLMAAAAQACDANIAAIVVSRSGTGRALTWTAARDLPESVAAN